MPTTASLSPGVPCVTYIQVYLPTFSSWTPSPDIASRAAGAEGGLVRLTAKASNLSEPWHLRLEKANRGHTDLQLMQSFLREGFDHILHR